MFLKLCTKVTIKSEISDARCVVFAIPMYNIYKGSVGSGCIMARFFEYNISEADTITGNIYDSDNPDQLRVELSHGSYSATFTDGYMKYTYGGAVPTGWLAPLPYLYFTRNSSQYAKVRLIVPHTKGTSNASSYVYPCFYEITFIPDKNFYDIN